MIARALRLLVIASWIAAAGCDHEAAKQDDFAIKARTIESKERQGEIDAAAREWRELAATAPTAEARAKAELGRARCEAALADRAHGRELLESLPAQVEGHSLAALEAIAAEQAARFAGGPFAHEFRELEEHVRELCRARALELRGQQLTAVRAILDRGEFCAALDALQKIERSRPPDDREDVAKLLEETNAASEHAADVVLAEVAEAAKSDPTAALRKLDEAFTRFQGSTGAPRIAKARAELAEIARKAAAGPVTTDGKNAAEHENHP